MNLTKIANFIPILGSSSSDVPPLFLRSNSAVPPLMLKRVNGGRADVHSIQYLTVAFFALLQVKITLSRVKNKKRFCCVGKSLYFCCVKYKQ